MGAPGETWTVPEVYLLTEGPDGTVAVPQLTLTFYAEGMEVDKADGEEVWHRAWSQLAELSPAERSVLPTGDPGVVVTVVERDGARRHRFVLGTADPDATDAFLRDLARAHGLRTRRPGRAGSALLLVGLAVAFVAVMTVLLLSAAHVVHL